MYCFCILWLLIICNSYFIEWRMWFDFDLKNFFFVFCSRHLAIIAINITYRGWCKAMHQFSSIDYSTASKHHPTEMPIQPAITMSSISINSYVSYVCKFAMNILIYLAIQQHQQQRRHTCTRTHVVAIWYGCKRHIHAKTGARTVSMVNSVNKRLYLLFVFSCLVKTVSVCVFCCPFWNQQMVTCDK